MTELLSNMLEWEDVSKAQLAHRLRRSKGFVTQILGGGRNLTLRTIADVADALGYRVRATAVKERESAKHHSTTLKLPMDTGTDWGTISGRFEHPDEDLQVANDNLAEVA